MTKKVTICALLLAACTLFAGCLDQPLGTVDGDTYDATDQPRPEYADDTREEVCGPPGRPCHWEEE